MSDINFSARAYCKIILHAAKYPHRSVNGVLLSKASSKGRNVEFVDAVPLFHISLNLTPMAEIALMLVEEVAGQLGLVISGYYSANEHVGFCSFEKSLHKIADKLITNFPSSCLVVLDNALINLDLDNIALKVAQFSDGSFKPIDPSYISLNPGNTLDICSQLLKKNVYELLIDFDNHLDNITLDWLNNELNKDIERITAICL